MPKAILEFNLPEDKEDFEMASNSGQYHCILWDMDQFLRQIIKYEDPKTKEEKLRQKFAEEFREYLYEQMRDRNIEL